jgi:peptidoglycan/xylan/chitin deacetylase (PgdA/CDA1 family)
LIKRTAKKLTTRLLSNRMASTLLRPLWQGRASIFLLHRLSNGKSADDSVTIASIAATLKGLRRAGAHFVSLSHLFNEAAQGREPAPGSVAFTIDDGFADQGVTAREAFERNGCPVTVFLITDFIDGRLWPWDDQIAYALKNSQAERITLTPVGKTFGLRTPAERKAALNYVRDYCKSVPWTQAQATLEATYESAGWRPPVIPPPEFRPLSWDDIRALESPYIEFAPHSLSHRITSQLPANEVRDEIEGSWRRLREELRRPTPVYAWPTGRKQDFTARDMEIAASAGLAGAVAVTNDYARFRCHTQSAANPLEKFSVARFSMSGLWEDNLQYGTAIERFKQTLHLAT